MKRKLLLISAILFGVVLLTLAVSAVLYSPEYMRRVLIYGESDVDDHLIFPERTIQKSSTPHAYREELRGSLSTMKVPYESEGKPYEKTLSQLVTESDTSALIIIHQDALVYEQYADGYHRESINTSFSAVKSMVSLLVGVAIEEGHINSVLDPISMYIQEFQGSPVESITIEELLLMRSNIRYREGVLWFTDDAKTYYMPDLRELVLKNLKVDPGYDGRFHYNNYHPLLLGMILERSTGEDVSHFFQRRVWDPIGAEYDASWSLDSVESGFEKMESGLNFRPIDLAKIGSMILHQGAWNGNRVVSEAWVSTSTRADFPIDAEDYRNSFLVDRQVGYKYMWYSMENHQGGMDRYAAGKYGQYLYISPENKTVIVRTGASSGGVDWWPGVLKHIASMTSEF